MPAKIRLARRGRRKQPYYHIVVADARAPRDGKFIEEIGFYNPMTKPATIEIDRDKAFDWLMKGAQPTDTARAILRFKGILYRKHLARGVAKGALTQEAADTKYQEWIDAKDAKVAERFEQTKKEKADFLKLVSGTAKPKKAVAAPEEAAAPFREDGADAPAVEATEATPADAPPADAPPAEVTEKVEASAVEEAKEAVVDAKEAVVEKATEVVADAKEAVADATEAVAEKAKEVAADVNEVVADATEAVKDAVTPDAGDAEKA